MTAAVELIVLLSDGGQYAVWLGIGMLGLILLNLVRKENSASVNKLFLTLAAPVIMPFWWTQPVFTLPEIIVTEWNIIPAAAFAVLIRLIYKGSDVVDLVSFADAVICVIVLFVAAMKSGYAADAVILGAAIVLILLSPLHCGRKGGLRWLRSPLLWRHFSLRQGCGTAGHGGYICWRQALSLPLREYRARRSSERAAEKSQSLRK